MNWDPVLWIVNESSPVARLSRDPPPQTRRRRKDFLRAPSCPWWFKLFLPAAAAFPTVRVRVAVCSLACRRSPAVAGRKPSPIRLPVTTVGFRSPDQWRMRLVISMEPPWAAEPMILAWSSNLPRKWFSRGGSLKVGHGSGDWIPGRGRTKKCGAESSDPNRHSQPRLPGSVVGEASIRHPLNSAKITKVSAPKLH